VPPRPRIRPRRAAARAAAAAIAAALLACAPAAAYPETWVPYQQVLAQVRSGPLIRAIINPIRGDIEIKFRNLDEGHAFYPRAQQPMLQRTLAARHIHTIFVARPHARSHPAAVHHHLRYIAAAVLALLALLGGALLVRSRRRRARGGPSAADAPAS
jgi:hypothetical protein